MSFSSDTFAIYPILSLKCCVRICIRLSTYQKIILRQYERLRRDVEEISRKGISWLNMLV
ncbi:hypothetical protein ECEC1846_4086 [Escherichia coli EC1846]|nr:hypothetical protein HMPREF9348_01161 [Escherichia coli MS 145-7]EHU55967.1 hypothetical protein ECDEC3B_3977 [Escherichia coli DEC3B]EKH29372.1 hypothetical protein ECFRIK1999_4235 [Escherichia coli FRIK1999]EKI67685.1 hypothetical protein ECEC1846_4086 [Escherichia coli EC1846]ELV68467.1 hypothetical protein EC991805_3459 [Escherichia coli 99.1805]EMV74034.1 hypothetical protein EC2866750_3273 [Escherichia coli 2866750]EMX50671.1 hypothetical protein ECJURUA2010_3098 [Escherichia coli Ju